MHFAIGAALIFVAALLLRYVWFNFVFDVDAKYKPAKRWALALRDTTVFAIFVAMIGGGMGLLIGAI